MDSWKRMLLANQAWVEDRLSVNPEYFEELAKGQQPTALWIGCSDSRVPAETVTGTEPGELFVHRNIANLVLHTDFNLLSVLSYAVEHLHVKHIIVCGHYGCGGVKAAMSDHHFGMLNHWLQQIKATYHDHQNELQLLGDEQKRCDRLVELNVLEQVHNLLRTGVVQEAWHLRDAPTVHGWVYGLKDGRLKDLVRVEPNSPIDDIFRYDMEAMDDELAAKTALIQMRAGKVPVPPQT